MNKWEFCKDKECPYCQMDLEDADYPAFEKVISYCHFCSRSFVD